MLQVSSLSMKGKKMGNVVVSRGSAGQGTELKVLLSPGINEPGASVHNTSMCFSTRVRFDYFIENLCLMFVYLFFVCLFLFFF